jgi:hypothetical protein
VGRKACTICAHPDRREIDELLAGGGSPTRLARRFKASKDAMRRHASNHLGWLLELALRGEYHGEISGIRSLVITTRTEPGGANKC